MPREAFSLVFQFPSSNSKAILGAFDAVLGRIFLKSRPSRSRNNNYTYPKFALRAGGCGGQ